jgi:hypothetical protein
MTETARKWVYKMPEVEVLVSKDEDEGFIYIDDDDLGDQLRELVESDGNPSPYVVDSGIGPYEYWGFRGYDSNIDVEEVETEEVSVQLFFTFDDSVPEEERKGAVQDALDLCDPVLTTYHTAEAKRSEIEYTVRWYGDVCKESRTVTYRGELA